MIYNEPFELYCKTFDSAQKVYNNIADIIKLNNKFYTVDILNIFGVKPMNLDYVYYWENLTVNDMVIYKRPLFWCISLPRPQMDYIKAGKLRMGRSKHYYHQLDNVTKDKSWYEWSKNLETKFGDKIPATSKEKEDLVNHPNHYQSETGLEVIDVIDAFTDGLDGVEAFDTGNIIKYICRWKKKNGIEDLEKAKWYLENLIKEVKEKENEDVK